MQTVKNCRTYPQLPLSNQELYDLLTHLKYFKDKFKTISHECICIHYQAMFVLIESELPKIKNLQYFSLKQIIENIDKYEKNDLKYILKNVFRIQYDTHIISRESLIWEYLLDRKEICHLPHLFCFNDDFIDIIDDSEGDTKDDSEGEDYHYIVYNPNDNWFDDDFTDINDDSKGDINDDYYTVRDSNDYWFDDID